MNSELQKLVTAAKLSITDAEKLSKLEPGTACQHKSWGLGKIAEWDLLGDRVIIDFETKSGHPMKLSFAAESLVPLPEDHILARRINDLPALQKMAKENPAALVELALKSHESKLYLDALDKLLTPRIIGTAEYKKWWDNAKKELKTSRHIVVPTKRADPLLLRAQDQKPGEIMVRNFLGARELRGKLAALTAIMKDLDLFENPAKELQPVFLDVTHMARKAWKLQPRETLQLVLGREELRESESVKAEIEHENAITAAEIMRDLRGQLADIANALPASLLGRFYREFPAAFPNGEWVKDALGHLTRTGGRAVDEITAVLDANDSLDVLAEFLKKAVRNRTLSTDLLIWIARERKGLAEPVFDMDLGNAIISALEDDHVAGGPKKTARLNDAFADDKTLVSEMVADAADEDLRLFAKRILNSPVFDELTRRSLMGKIIKARPEMEKLMEDNAESQRGTSLIVSWESLEKKKLELDDINTVQIPQNKRDIQTAREYGDLRENFEYKSARQQQAVLLRMQSKMERELRNAQGTDFADVGTDKVSIGNVVDIVDAETGATETFTILGAWDGDPEKNIISYLSETAKALIGKVVGDEVDLPADTADGSRKAKVVAIRAFKA
jgi:transcription elongation GreA/GreB family factor